MTKKPNPPEQQDKNLNHSEEKDTEYEIEEMVFSRQNYDTTASYEMDFDKIKKMTITSGKLPVSEDNDKPEPLSHRIHNQSETDDIKKSLAEMREAEKVTEREGDSSPGLWEKFKRFFAR